MGLFSKKEQPPSILETESAAPEQASGERSEQYMTPDQRAQEKLDNAKVAMSKFGSRMGGYLKNLLMRGGSAVKEHIKNMPAVFKEATVGGIEKDIKSGLKVYEHGKDAAAATRGSLGELRQNAGEFRQDVENSFGEAWVGAVDLFEGAKQTVGRGAEKAKSDLGEAGQIASEMVWQKIDGAKAKYQSMKGRAVEHFSSFADKLKNIADAQKPKLEKYQQDKKHEKFLLAEQQYVALARELRIPVSSRLGVIADYNNNAQAA